MGKPIEREIAKGETHVYEVVVPSDRVVNGVVDQRGVDVVVRIIDPKGAVVATVDSPNPEGPEPWSMDGKTPGIWHIEVSPLPETGKPGRYEARVDEVVTSNEHAERVAKLRYQSPRMLQLWKEQRADGAKAIERFAKEMEGHAPLVEPVANNPQGDVFITFATRVQPDTHYVGLLSAPTVDGREAALARFEDTDLFSLTLRIPKDARFTYRLRPGEPFGFGWTQKEAMAAMSTTKPDVWNPHTFEMESLVELPSAPTQTWAKRVEGVPAGRVIDRTVHSDILGEDRKVGVYLPAAFDPAGGPYPYVIVFDGDTYGHSSEPSVPTPIILDNLIAQGKVPPMLGVLVDSGNTRNRDLAMSAPFGDFLAKELAPWVRREYRAATDPAKVTLAGSSLGGLAAVYGAFHHPDVFGNALSQSGSFWFAPGLMEEAETMSPFHIAPGAMMREILAAPAQPLRVWMEVRLFEGAGVGFNRHIRDVLLAKGYSVNYHEYTGGHDYVCWRGSLADGLIALAGAGRKD
jgi:enterochelin esterase family protein